MTERPVTIVRHGWAWPDAATTATLGAAVADAFGPDTPIVDARERETRPVGGASLVNAAVRSSASAIVVVIEAGVTVDADGLRRLSAAATAGSLAIAVLDTEAGAAGEPWFSPPAGDLLVAVRDAMAAGGLAHAQREATTRPRAWALARSTFDALGGLDDALWNVGEVDDLGRRARAQGVDVARVACRVASHGDAYPLPDTTRGFLAVRNALISAWRTEPRDSLGRTLATVAATAIGDAWRAADIDVARFRFGGTWGRRSRFGRAPSRPGAEGAPWPADEAGTLAPLLALDAFLGHVTSTTRVDRHAQRRASVEAGLPRMVAPARAWPALPPTPLVSVVVVNWNGREHLEACFGSIIASDYPRDRLDVICVDNGSTDGSRELLAGRFPDVRVVALDENRGFTGGNNAGVAVARGDVFVFLNNDMRIAPDAISRLVGALDDRTVAVSARVLDWNGRRIDFVRGTVNFEARGFQERYGETDRPEWTVVADSFFPNGGAFAVTRAAYDAAGGFDPGFFAYYDDVDLGWRLRLAGGRVRVAREAVVYHRHGATSSRQPAGQKRFLMERNALWTAMKNYGDAALDRVLGPMLLLAVRRLVAEVELVAGGLDASLAPWLAPDRAGRGRPTTATLLYGAAAPTPGGRRVARRVPIESLAAAGTAIASLPGIIAAREAVQSRRVADDRDVLSHLGRPLDYTAGIGTSMAAHDALVERLGLGTLLPRRPVVLLVTHEPLRGHLSGPGVRVVEMARALTDVATPLVATPHAPEMADPEVSIVGFDPNAATSLRRLAEQADVIVVQGFMLARFPFLGTIGARLVVDLYCPFTIEHLQMKTASLGPGDAVAFEEFAHEAAAVLDVQNDQLGEGDFFLCASERQRDFWLGALHTAGRVNARTYADDETLRALVDVVPFGLPAMPVEEAARRAAGGAAVMKGARPGIGANDRVLLWAGSVLDWQDPQTLVRAVARLASRRADVKLFFMGTRHPNPEVPPMRAVEESRAIARDLGVLDTHVFFNDWVRYDERAVYLAEADLGVSTHRDHLETRYAFRTRMLDYLWARLPIVCSDGDYFASLVRDRELGLVVPPGDAGALAAAIERLLDDRALADRCRAALAEVSREFEWRQVVAPLRRYLAAPWFAADRATRLKTTHERLARGFRLTKWAKRTALSLGATEGQIEEVKQWRLVRAAMGLRNRVALARAKRRE